MRYSPSATSLIAFAAADTARAGDTAPVAEIVTFRLAEGAEPAEFARVAETITPFLERTGAVISRTLSVDDSGLWTDHITWRSMHQAKEAAEALMQQPEAGPMMTLIDPETVILRHAPIRLTMTPE